MLLQRWHDSYLCANRSLFRLSPCSPWPGSCTRTARCARPCPRWKWRSASSPWPGESRSCSCPATWRRCCRWETRWLRTSSRSAYLRHRLLYPVACSLASTHSVTLYAGVFGKLSFFCAIILHVYSLSIGFNLDKMFSLFCSQALSMCCLKHCVALWQLLISLKSENMLRLKRVSYEVFRSFL